MNITLNGVKITQDTKNLAFKKNNLVDVMNITVDTDESYQYKLDVEYPAKCCSGEKLYNVIDLARTGDVCTVGLTADMLPFAGKYTMQLRGVSGDKVYHTDTFEVWVKYSIDVGDVYNPVPSEFYQIEDNITEMNNHPPIPGNNGYWLVWNVTKQEYEESDVPLPDGTLPDIAADTSGKYLSNDGKKAYWAEVQAGGENKIDAIEVNGVEQPIVDKTVNITVPTKTSDLSNDSGYITNEALNGYATKAELPTKVSQLENDSKYITALGAPVQSVNGKTGAVVLDAESIGAQNKITGAATTITDSNLTANCALVSDANGKVAVSHVTATELARLDGVTSNVQTQLNSKQGADDNIQATRLRGGINSIINNASAVSINPAVNAAGFLRYNGGNVQIFYDGILMPFQNWEIDTLFDGKSGTNLNFGRGPRNAQTACLWNETTNYPQNARVMYQTTSGVFRWYKALKESKGVIPEGDSTEAWEDVSSSKTPSMMDVRNLEVSIVIDSYFELRWENGASFYWRAAKQNCSYYKIEIYNSITNQYVLVAERDNIPIEEVVNTQYMGASVDGTGKRVRITLRAQSSQDAGWFAVTQIAFTGISGGIEGTLLNRGGGTMYGNLSPYTSGGASLGTGSARWNEVHANKIYGDGSNLTNLPIDGLPPVTTADNGKTLRVVNGVWTVAL